MNKTTNIVFVTLGVLFIILLLVGAGFYLSSTLGTQSSGRYPTTPTATITSTPSGTSSQPAGETTEETGGTEFTLTADQKQALSSFGIDPASVPSTIPAEQEACFVAELGNTRVEEIKSGAAPSALDFFRAKSCL